MTTSNPLFLWLITSVGQLPEVLVCTVAAVWVLSQSHRLAPAAKWAVAGFGLSMALALTGPGAHLALQHWMIARYATAESIGVVFMVFGLFWSALHALAYIFLAVAIIHRRPELTPNLPPPVPPSLEKPPSF